MGGAPMRDAANEDWASRSGGGQGMKMGYGNALYCAADAAQDEDPGLS